MKLFLVLGLGLTVMARVALANVVDFTVDNEITQELDEVTDALGGRALTSATNDISAICPGADCRIASRSVSCVRDFLREQLVGNIKTLINCYASVRGVDQDELVVKREKNGVWQSWVALSNVSTEIGFTRNSLICGNGLNTESICFLTNGKEREARSGVIPEKALMFAVDSINQATGASFSSPLSFIFAVPPPGAKPETFFTAKGQASCAIAKRGASALCLIRTTENKLAAILFNTTNVRDRRVLSSPKLKSEPSCLQIKDGLARCYIVTKRGELQSIEFDGHRFSSLRKLGVRVFPQTPTCVTVKGASLCIIFAFRGKLVSFLDDGKKVEFQRMKGRFPNNEPSCLVFPGSVRCFVRGYNFKLFELVYDIKSGRWSKPNRIGGILPKQTPSCLKNFAGNGVVCYVKWIDRRLRFIDIDSQKPKFIPAEH